MYGLGTPPLPDAAGSRTDTPMTGGQYLSGYTNLIGTCLTFDSQKIGFGAGACVGVYAGLAVLAYLLIGRGR